MRTVVAKLPCLANRDSVYCPLKFVSEQLNNYLKNCNLINLQFELESICAPYCSVKYIFRKFPRQVVEVFRSAHRVS